MKIERLKKKLVVNATIAIALVVAMSLIIFLNLSYVNGAKDEIKKINGEALAIKGEITTLQSQIVEFRKYSKIWNEMDEKKKSTAGIKIDEINKALKETSKKYLITKTDIKVELPKEIKLGIFNRKTIKVMHSPVKLTFSAIRDTDAIAFIEDFTKSLTGYKIVSNISINKDKDYEKDDYIRISKGDLEGKIVGNLTFNWYVFENKSNK